MNIEYYKEYSHHLGRDMEFKRYGHAGKCCIAFPCQDGHFYDFENFHMIDEISSFIESGKVQIFCVDGVDPETLTSNGDPRWRIERYEAWYYYVMEEMMPRIYEISGSTEKLMTTGCSLGALHAANFFFRRPDVFDTVIALSGLYQADYYFKGYCDDLVYANSPILFLENMPADHPYIELYNEGRMIFCVGQGAWEEELFDNTKKLQGILERKGIHAWFDYWGHDVNHDWPWWFRQMNYFLGHLFP